MAMQAQPLFDYIGQLPECPTWSAREQALWWTDILACEIHRYHPASGAHRVLRLPGEVGCFALCENGALLMRVDNNLSAHVIQCDIHGHNGLAFSPDGGVMYTSDTPNAVIWRTPLDEYGEPGKREVFRRFVPGEGVPDGAAMDVEGCYWSAMYDGFRIARFSPTGEQLDEYRLPVRCPTMVCFGGPQMKTLYITTTREDMQEDELADRPLSGAIFTLEAPVAGKVKPRFRCTV